MMNPQSRRLGMPPEETPFLYHGTTETVARAALAEGLKPRGVTKAEGNWDCASHEDAVYLTTVYAPYFAYSAVDDDKKENWGVVEVDTRKLGKEHLYPDEDYLEQVARFNPEEFDIGPSMEERTDWFKEHLEDFKHLWEASLDGIGNCSFRGSVPPEAITRVAIFDPESNPTVAVTAIDPTITLMNYKICKEKYEALTQWFMGVVHVEALCGIGYLTSDEGMRQRWAEEFNKIGGLEVLHAR